MNLGAIRLCVTCEIYIMQVDGFLFYIFQGLGLVVFERQELLYFLCIFVLF